LQPQKKKRGKKESTTLVTGKQVRRGRIQLIRPLPKGDPSTRREKKKSGIKTVSRKKGTKKREDLLGGPYFAFLWGKEGKDHGNVR